MLPQSERFRILSRFTERFFASIDKFKTGSYSPKWREVDIRAPLGGLAAISARRKMAVCECRASDGARGRARRRPKAQNNGQKICQEFSAEAPLTRRSSSKQVHPLVSATEQAAALATGSFSDARCPTGAGNAGDSQGQWARRGFLEDGRTGHWRQKNRTPLVFQTPQLSCRPCRLMLKKLLKSPKAPMTGSPKTRRESTDTFARDGADGPAEAVETEENDDPNEGDDSSDHENDEGFFAGWDGFDEIHELSADEELADVEEHTQPFEGEVGHRTLSELALASGTLQTLDRLKRRRNGSLQQA